MEVDRSAHFAPVKNANGAKADTPATAKAAVLGLHKRWQSLQPSHAAFQHYSMICRSVIPCFMSLSLEKMLSSTLSLRIPLSQAGVVPLKVSLKFALKKILQSWHSYDAKNAGRLSDGPD